MPVTLHVTNGPSVGQTIYVARGQIIKIGRTEWADVSFPDDQAMAEVHFEVLSAGADCMIRDCSGGVGTRLNDAEITEEKIHSGDSITAGETEFSVTVVGESAIVPLESSDGSDGQNSAETPVRVPVAADYCRSLKLSLPAQKLLDEKISPLNYLDRLTEELLYPDVLRFVAFLLPRTEAISWGCDCVEQTLAGDLGARDRQALDAARTWANEPNESNCRTAERIANDCNCEGASSWLALAAFWSGDSLAPAGLQAVPPGEGLTAEAITGALMQTAPYGDAGKTHDRYEAFLDAGRKRLPADLK